MKTFILGALAAVCLSVTADEKPNIIVILADDLGYADVGFHDVVAEDIETPNLDTLAETGIIFTEAYSSSPVCSNSRLSLSTGRYAQRWGAYYYGQGGMPTTESSIAEMMLQAGYRTMKVGKTHMNYGPKSHPLDHGFERNLGFKQHSWDFNMLSQKDLDAYENKKAGSVKQAYNTIGFGPLTRDRDTKESYEDTTTTEVFGNESVKFISEKSSKPFYLQLEFNAVHTPLYRAPKQLIKKYGVPERPFDRNAEVWEYPFWDPVAQPDFKQWYSQTCHLEIADAYGRKMYLAHLELMDHMIGKILATLEEKGLRENTIIFFSSDNGGSDQSYANNGDINAYKYCLMDGGIKVPMVLSWPKKFAANKRIDSLVTHRDLFPTLSDITKIAPSKDLDGKSLLPLIDGSVEQIHEDPMHWDTGPREKNWVVRHGDWKLVYRETSKNYHAYELDDNGLVKETFREIPIPSGYQLYNLAQDPGETKNLSNQYPEKTELMKKLHIDWRANMSDPVRGKNAK